LNKKSTTRTESRNRNNNVNYGKETYVKKQQKSRKNNQTKDENTANQKKQNNTKTELKPLENKHYPLMTELPIDIRTQLRNFFSKTFDEKLDLIINLSGKYIDEKQRSTLKKKAETELFTEIEKGIINNYNLAVKLGEEQQQKRNLDALSVKEKFYSLTDSFFKSSNIVSIPENVHAFDFFFQICKELQREFRFETGYVKFTNYNLYLLDIEKLVANLKRDKVGLPKAWAVLMTFLGSDDFYFIVQTTLQKLGYYYAFLGIDALQVDKEAIDSYLEIYLELAGIYEKIISLISTLIQMTEMPNISSYDRKRNLFQILFHVEKTGYKNIVDGFDRNIRNSLAHRAFKVNIIDNKVEFVDRKKKLTLSYNEVQKRTRELSALLLILPHIYVAVFCSLILEIEEMLEKLPK
jgi:hypothetical protein